MGAKQERFNLNVSFFRLLVSSDEKYSQISNQLFPCVIISQKKLPVPTLN